MSRERMWRDMRPVLDAFLRARPGLLVLGAGLSMLTVAMGMGLLGLSGWFITATGLAGLSAGTALAFDVFQPSAGIRLLALGRTGARYGERLVTHDATLAVLAGVREQLFRGWARPEAARQLLLRPARLLFRLTADTDALESLYLRVLVPIATALAAALLAGVVVGAVHAVLGICLAVGLACAGGGIAWTVARRAQAPAVVRARGIEALRAQAVDLVAGQTDLAMAGRLAAQCQALAATDLRLARVDDALHRLEVRAGFAYGVLAATVLGAVLVAVAAAVETRRMGAPGAALALLLALTATEPFAGLRRGALEFGRTRLAARRLGPAMHARGEEAQQADTVLRRRAEPGPAIELHGVRLAHAGSPVAVFQALSLKVQPGERVALVGASGAGKSTLLAAVAGDIAPQSGTLHALPCTWLTQKTELFQDSLAENLRLAAPDASDERLWQVLEAAGLAGDVRALAEGLATRLGEGGMGLSGGQARRLALARLLLRDAPLWLLDEPTEALDARTARDVLERLACEARGRTVVVATHLRREAALADRLVILRDSQVHADIPRTSPEFGAALQALRAD